MLLPARELAWQVFRAVSHSHLLPCLGRTRLPFRRFHPAIRQRQVDVLEHREIANQIETLEDEPDVAVSETSPLRHRQVRDRADIRIAPKHVLSALVAPLKIHASGTCDQPVAFAGATFAPGVPTTCLYVFNSYRVTYRYEPVRRENWMFGVGITLKARDAETQLEAGGTSAAKTDVGVVPLVNFKLERRLGA